MTEVDRIRDQIERAFDGDPWCGPSLRAVLAGVSADQAATRVPGVAHSIGAIVLHVAGWQDVVARRIAGEPIALPEGGEWPRADAVGDHAWQEALGRLDASHQRLLQALESVDPARLDAKIGDSRNPAMGSGMTAYATLQGVAQHAMYHAGQIALLKKWVDSD